ncbi:hypothetical protein G4B88_016526 [Cannabis sativa]|uniref:Uncharacterized protein n=1 Tax=Cannabis sativa TaxID=3483 RepID=A0A7J6H7F8_CANSA|nr:hypothetical protein G4B88_016526 [Cannabis sativa]
MFNINVFLVKIVSSLGVAVVARFFVPIGCERHIEEILPQKFLVGDSNSLTQDLHHAVTNIPNNSVISKSSWLIISLGSFQSKWYNKNASGSSTLISPNDIPGHILLPTPNGIYSKLFPLKSILLSRNLSGIKLSGSVQYLGSLPIAHALTMILPLITHFSLLSLGSNNGEEGCNLRVSFTIDFKYFKSLIPVSSTMPFLLNTCLTSSCAFFITLGFLIISAIAQSTIVADVSVPAVKMS